MKDWQIILGKLVWYGGIYLFICGLLLFFWIGFFLTPNVPPLWQQVIGGILLPFGLLIRLPADSLTGIVVCMVLNTLFWMILILTLQKRISNKQ